MAIEDDKYNAVVDAVNSFIGTGRKRFVEQSLLTLAKDIFALYGYEIVVPTQTQKEPSPPVSS